ncbi:hypothetical protein D7Z54_32080 [Salibacterium salarium]|uniref:Phosphoglyceromutase n=1 Tax=Salibacterium salarium TaxID=284579 RepID=A0A428MT36_9BACI|nr:hypothetical protein [Salibacterium salarium]RSL29292.1 hypothetical protein D7Z54_32080 [Salibacterium salarium]
MIIKMLMVVCMVIGCMLGTPFSSQAQTKDQHVVLVLVPGLSMNNFFLLMEEEQMQSQSSVIALNRITAGAVDPVNEMLTLSSGLPAEASSLGEENGLSVEKSSTSERMQKYKIFNFEELVEKNKQTTYKARPGSIGETLSNAGVFPSFVGHSDVKEKKYQFASYLTIDGTGETVAEREMPVDKKQKEPGGYKMNVDKTIQAVGKLQDRNTATWTVVEWGDIYRFNQDPDSTASDELVEPLKELLFQLKEQNQTVFLLGVHPPEETMEKGYRMNPFVKWEDTSSPSSIKKLDSATVNQLFLGSSLDIAPTILRTFHLSPPSRWQGEPLDTGEPAKLGQMKKEIDGAATVYVTRGPILSTYISILVVLLIVGYFFWKRNRNPRRWASMWINGAVLAGMTSPLSFELAPALFGRAQVDVPLYCTAVTIFSVLIGAVGVWVGAKRMVWMISSLLLIVLSADLLVGTPLMQRSYLGYDPLIGARYVGIGNELGGFFVAASVLFLEPFIKQKKWIVFVFILLFVVLLGSSMFGQNAGVTLASGCMYIVLLWWSEKNRRWNMLKMMWSAFAGLLGLLGLLWLIQQVGETSHIGRFFQQLIDGEWAEIRNVITRKLQMNAKIILHSNWTKLLLTSYVLAVLYLLFEKNNTMTTSQQIVLKAGTVGSICLLVLNDSGAVAASTSMFYLLCARYVWSHKEES